MTAAPLVRAAALAAAVLLLASCSGGPRPRPTPTPEIGDAGQVTRERALSARDDWTLTGRLGVSDGRDGGSGTLEWSQRGDTYRFTVHAPVTGKTWTLEGGPGHVRLQGLRERVVEAGDAADLLRRELGWEVPVDQLRDWVRALRAPGDARIVYGPGGLPESIEQAGWTVRYADYDEDKVPALPRRVFAANGHFTVRLAIRDWSPP